MFKAELIIRNEAGSIWFCNYTGCDPYIQLDSLNKPGVVNSKTLQVDYRVHFGMHLRASIECQNQFGIH